MTPMDEVEDLDYEEWPNLYSLGDKDNIDLQVSFPVTLAAVLEAKSLTKIEVVGTFIDDSEECLAMIMTTDKGVEFPFVAMYTNPRYWYKAEEHIAEMSEEILSNIQNNV